MDSLSDVPVMTHLLADLRFARRRLARRPGVLATAVAALVLGMSATTAMFSVVDAVLLEKLPWRESDRLVSIRLARPEWRGVPALAPMWDQGSLSWPEFQDLQQSSQLLEAVGIYSSRRPVLRNGEAEVVPALLASASFLPMLGVTAARGRVFEPADDAPGAASLVITHEAWQRRFGGDPRIVGTRVEVDDRPREIVGVLAPGFSFGTDHPEILLPMGDIVHPSGRARDNHSYDAIARLRSDVTIDAARAEAGPIVRAGGDPAKLDVRLDPLLDAQVGDTRRPLLILLTGAGLLLLIACTNVAGLLLGELPDRRHEIAVRQSLGASTRRILRQLFVEGLVLSAISAGLAVIGAMWMTRWLVALVPASLPRAESIGIDSRVFLFALALAVLTAVIFAIAPALLLNRTSRSESLAHSSRYRRMRSSGLQNVLTVSQVALAIVLVTGAALLVETVRRLNREPIGFDPGGVAIVSLRTPPAKFPTREARLLAVESIERRLSTLAGVSVVGSLSDTPFGGGFSTNGIQFKDRAWTPDASAQQYVVTPGLLAALRIPLISGRWFDDRDRPGAEPVAVVSAEFSRRFLQGSALGQRFEIDDVWWTIVGIVGNTRHRDFRDRNLTSVYVPAAQHPTVVPTSIALQITRPLDDLATDIRQLSGDAAPGVVVSSTIAMTDLLGRSVATERYRAVLATVFGAVALVLAIIGVYGALTRRINDQRPEIGVRLALGARPADVARLVTLQGGRLLLLAAAIGLPAAFVVSRLAAALLYGVSPTSPVILLVIAATVLLVAIAAIALPARRASRTDPTIVLRV
jgi:predicted permease